MKGLLLKDWYMMIKYCKMFLLIVVGFMVISFLGSDTNLFFMFYPCVLSGMIPVTLLSYDESSHWLSYCGTLPYTKAQIVSSKYLIGFLSQIAILLATIIAQGIRVSVVYGDFHIQEMIVLTLAMCIVASLGAAVCLPCVFKWGVEKGRIAYCLMIGFVCASSVIFSHFVREGLPAGTQSKLLLAVLAVASIGIYILSWCLSVAFYRKREV